MNPLLTKLITDSEFRWRLFEIQMEAMTMAKQTNTPENGNVFVAYWVMPDRSECGTASRHPDKDELIDFCRRAMIEKIGMASIAASYKIYEMDSQGNKIKVYDSAKNN